MYIIFLTNQYIYIDDYRRDRDELAGGNDALEIFRKTQLFPWCEAIVSHNFSHENRWIFILFTVVREIKPNSPGEMTLRRFFAKYCPFLDASHTPCIITSNEKGRKNNGIAVFQEKQIMGSYTLKMRIWMRIQRRYFPRMKPKRGSSQMRSRRQCIWFPWISTAYNRTTEGGLCRRPLTFSGSCLVKSLVATRPVTCVTDFFEFDCIFGWL